MLSRVRFNFNHPYIISLVEWFCISYIRDKKPNIKEGVIQFFLFYFIFDNLFILIVYYKFTGFVILKGTIIHTTKIDAQCIDIYIIKDE